MKHLNDSRKQSVTAITVHEISTHSPSQPREGTRPEERNATNEGRNGLISQPQLAEVVQRHWVRVPQAADYAGVSRDTIYTAVERGELQHTRVGGRRAIRLRLDWV